MLRAYPLQRLRDLTGSFLGLQQSLLSLIAIPTGRDQLCLQLSRLLGSGGLCLGYSRTGLVQQQLHLLGTLTSRVDLSLSFVALGLSGRDSGGEISGTLLGFSCERVNPLRRSLCIVAERLSFGLMCRYCSGGLVPFACEDPKLFRMLRELDLYLALGFLDRDLAGLGLTPCLVELVSHRLRLGLSTLSSLGGLLNLLSSFCLGTLNSLCQPRIGLAIDLCQSHRGFFPSGLDSLRHSHRGLFSSGLESELELALLLRGGLKLLSEALRLCAGVLCGFLGFACSDLGILDGCGLSGGDVLRFLECSRQTLRLDPRLIHTCAFVSERGLQRFCLLPPLACLCPGVVRRLLRCSQCLIRLTAYRGHFCCGLRLCLCGGLLCCVDTGLHCFELARRRLHPAVGCIEGLLALAELGPDGGQLLLETLDFRSRHRLSVSSGLLSLGRTPHGFFETLSDAVQFLLRGVERILCLLVLDLELFDGIPCSARIGPSAVQCTLKVRELCCGFLSLSSGGGRVFLSRPQGLAGLLGHRLRGLRGLLRGRRCLLSHLQSALGLIQGRSSGLGLLDSCLCFRASGREAGCKVLGPCFCRIRRLACGFRARIGLVHPCLGGIPLGLCRLELGSGGGGIALSGLQRSLHLLDGFLGALKLAFDGFSIRLGSLEGRARFFRSRLGGPRFIARLGRLRLGFLGRLVCALLGRLSLSRAGLFDLSQSLFELGDLGIPGLCR